MKSDRIHLIRLKNARSLINQLGGRSKFSKTSELPYNLLTQYVGKNPTINIGERFARKLEKSANVVEGWLDRDHDAESSVLIERENLAFIKCLDIDLSAGMGALVFEEESNGRIPVSKAFLRELNVKAESCCVVYAKGDCMAPDINDGDQVIVDLETTEVFNGAVYAIRLDGSVMIKRLYKNFDGGVTIVCDNPLEKKYFPDTVLSVDRIEARLFIIGEVIIIQKKAKRRRA